MNNLLKPQIEAILFTMGDAVETARIAQALETDEEQIQQALDELTEEYDKKKHGIKIIKLEDSYQMCTKPEMYESLIRIAHVPKKHVLTDVLLETLSIIAYKQPITRVAIENIRGVKCDHAVNKLIEYNLVTELGRLDAPGRPLLFGTTEEFLRCFGIKSLEDLPTVGSELMDDFTSQANEEVEKINIF